MKGSDIPHFLCDTWWYGLTDRLSDKKFRELALLRRKQNFTAIQLVVGIPPEIGPENRNAKGNGRIAWDLKGEFSPRYLNHAIEKIKILNSFGFLVIIYGAWGYQIEWSGKDQMIEWWKAIINKVDGLNVMYCLTGESDLWVGQESKLFPDKSTDQLNAGFNLSAPSFLNRLGKKVKSIIKKSVYKSQLTKRRMQWSYVLTEVSKLTKKPIMIHTVPGEISEEVVSNPNFLAAVTVQTGHDLNSRNDLWRLPLRSFDNYPGKLFINLEPWYEGIRDNFGKEDQLNAYWFSMMAGAHAYCYGAHGVWNMGDGRFLAHWGKQTLDQAMKLDTPKLIGKSHELFTYLKIADYRKIEVEDTKGLIVATRINDNGHKVTYFSDMSLVGIIPKGRIFLPLKGQFSDHLPKKGSAIIFS